MAFLLYKYIKKTVQKTRESKKLPQEAFEQHLIQENHSKFEHSEETKVTPESGIKNTNDGDSSSANRAEGSTVKDEEVPVIDASSSPPERTKEEKRAARIYRWKLVGGLFLPFSVQALENTVLAGAYPFIASDFNELSQLNWIVSAFNLCAATFIPFWGQIADVFGRYAALQAALAVMIVGSSLCSGAPTTSFPMLLVGRGLQGMGCAGLNIIVRTCLADKVSLEENAKNNTIFTIVAGVAYGIGPVIGGYLTEVTWRWCFIINIPIGVAGMALAHILLRKELLPPQAITRSDGVATETDKPATLIQRLSTIDYGGQFLFLFGMGLLVLALTWGGSYYPWSNTNVLVPLIIGCLLVIAFVVWEYYMIAGHQLASRFPYIKPMIPLKLIFSKNASIIIYINFITGMAMYAAFYFVDLYFTLVLNYGPSKAGTNIIYYLPGLGAGAYLAIFMCNVYPKQTWWPLFIGTVLEPLGITILAIGLQSQSKPVIYGMLALTGVGTGIRFMPGTLHGVGYYPHHIASIVSLILLAASLGGTFSMTIMLNIFNNKMRAAGLSFATSTSSFSSIDALPPTQQTYLRTKAKESITLSFFALSAFLWLGVLAMAGLGNVDVGVRKRRDGREREEGVTKGTYLGSLVRRRRRGKGIGRT